MKEIDLPARYTTELGAAWAGSSVNCKPYTVEPIIVTPDASGQRIFFGSFFDDSGRLACYRWSCDTGECRIIRATVPTLPDDAHFSNSVQIDRYGTLHVSGGAHRNTPFHFTWDNFGAGENLVDRTSLLPPETGDASYPSFLRVGDRLFLLYRLGIPDRSRWRVVEWLDQGWSEKIITLVSGTIQGSWSAGPYLNQPIYLDHGRIGLVYCWRSRRVQRGTLDPKNIGLDYAEFLEGLDGARTSDDLILASPITPANSERIVPVRWAGDLSNQSGAASLSDGTPVFAAAWREPGEKRQIRFAWRTSRGGWSHRAITDFEDDFEMRGKGTLATPYSRPSVVPGPEGSAIVLYRDSRNGGRLLAQRLLPGDFRNDSHGVRVLVGGGLDQYEPVVERLATARTGLVTCYVQRAEQVLGGDVMRRSVSQPARLMAWDYGLEPQ